MNNRGREKMGHAWATKSDTQDRSDGQAEDTGTGKAWANKRDTQDRSDGQGDDGKVMGPL